jgi:predicted acetyltransferase
MSFSYSAIDLSLRLFIGQVLSGVKKGLRCTSFFVVYYKTVSVSDGAARKVWCANDEIKSIWKEAVVANGGSILAFWNLIWSQNRFVLE